MEFTFKSSLILIASLLSSATFALSSSMPFAFLLNAGETYTLPLKQLYADTYYDISCKVVDTDKSQQGFNGLQINSLNSRDISIDDSTYPKARHVNVKSKMEGSSVRILHVYNQDSITVQNLDFFDSIHFDCTADMLATD